MAERDRSTPIIRRGKYKQDIYVRFWSKVDKENGPLLAHVVHLGQCWMWISGRTPHGYGSIAVGRTMIRANRMSWNIHFGPIPDDLWVCHHCDNPSCVRPEHLFVDTPAGNAGDMVRKGRHRTGRGDRHSSKTRPERVARGERHGQAKITDSFVREIRARHAAGESCYAIGKQAGLDNSTVCRIVNRQRWKHVV